MNKPQAIKSKATNKRKLNEPLLGSALLIVFFPVSSDIQDLSAVPLQSDTIWEGKALSSELFGGVVIEIEFAIGFVNIIFAVFRSLERANAPVNFFLLSIHYSKFWLWRTSKFNVPVGTQDLHTSQNRPTHTNVMGDPRTILKIGTGMGDDEIFCIDAF